MDVVGLIAAGIALLGVIVSIVVAVQAKAESKQTLAIARVAADAQVRMADAAERNASTRANDGEGGPRVGFTLERRDRSGLALRNLGPERATSVTIADDLGGITRDLPSGVTLDPWQSHTFRVFDTWQSRFPDQVRVTADQVPEGVWVPVPPKM